MRALTAFGLVCLLFSTMGAGCKTKRDIRREQEYERIKADVREARGARADLEVISEEFRTELTRLSTAVEEQGQLARVQNEEMRKELLALNTKVATLEKEMAAAKAEPPPKVVKPASYETAKELFEAEKYEEAIEEAKTVVRNKPKTSAEARKALYLLGEAYFEAGDYGGAALQFSEYKRAYPKDGGVAGATLRQAQCFRSLGKEKEAKLFYQEVLDKFPKSSAAAQAKKEIKKAK